MICILPHRTNTGPQSAGTLRLECEIRGTLIFLPQLEMRPSFNAPKSVESREAPPTPDAWAPEKEQKAQGILYLQKIPSSVKGAQRGSVQQGYDPPRRLKLPH